MCFRCPTCDCRDPQGYSTHPTGGVLGFVRAVCGAIEYQANATPHFHCNVYAESIWQEPLSCLLQKTQDKHIDFGALQHFHEWIHTEQHPHPADHVEQARGASILLRKRMARQLQQGYSQSFGPVARFPSMPLASEKLCFLSAS